MTTINQRKNEIKNIQSFIVIKQSIDKLDKNTIICTIDYWLKRTLNGQKKAVLYTERYVVLNYLKNNEEIYLDETNLSNVTRMKAW